MEQPPNGGNGNITTQFTIWCWGCAQWDQLDVKRKSFAIGQWFTQGWVKRKINDEKVWLCTNCAEVIKEVK